MSARSAEAFDGDRGALGQVMPRTVHRCRTVARVIRSANVALILACLGIACSAAAQNNRMTGIPLTTEIHLQDPGWWPTKGAPSRKAYAGTAVCAQCHSDIAATYRETGMAHAAMPASESQLLQRNTSLALQLGLFIDKIVTTPSSSTFVVSDGISAISRSLGWEFGKGLMGQTYVYENGGAFYEAHLSFFTSIHGLDITPGQIRSTPATIEQAAARRMPPEEAPMCFGCHTTEATVNHSFDPHKSVMGVGCEDCHGPGASHAAVMSLGGEGGSATQIFNPARLDPVDSVDFCGACHRTWQDVVMGGFAKTGTFTVRFAPYRLENSRCWGTNGDARLTCIACHDPHKPLVTDAGSYDRACLQCHILRRPKKLARHPGAACPVAVKNCVTCHMPKYVPPGLHYAFVDHWIRIVRPGQPYPN